MYKTWPGKRDLDDIDDDGDDRIVARETCGKKTGPLLLFFEIYKSKHEPITDMCAEW